MDQCRYLSRSDTTFERARTEVYDSLGRLVSRTVLEKEIRSGASARDRLSLQGDALISEARSDSTTRDFSRKEETAMATETEEIRGATGKTTPDQSRKKSPWWKKVLMWGGAVLYGGILIKLIRPHWSGILTAIKRLLKLIRT